MATSKTKKHTTSYEISASNDNYTEDVLRERYFNIKSSYICVSKMNEEGLPIRNQNPPEDVTENIVKFVMRNYDGDETCVWAKSVGMKGDVYSSKFSLDKQPEIKSFTSNGPSSFGPRKKFGVLYFLDMRDWLNDHIVVWRVNLTDESPEFKQLKMNKMQTFQDQSAGGRRPHIAWKQIYPQIKEFCVQVYDGTFEGIFTKKITAESTETQSN